MRQETATAVPPAAAAAAHKQQPQVLAGMQSGLLV
jgi:hypothetical protein